MKKTEAFKSFRLIFFCRSVVIKYKEYGKRIDNFCKSRHMLPAKSHINYSFFDLNFIVNQDIYRSNYDFDVSNGGEHIFGGGSSFGWTAPYHQMCLIKKAIPEQITMDNTIIKFDYNTLTSLSKPEYDIIVLNSIKISSNNDTHQEIKFDYKRSKGKDYIFLNKLSIGDKRYGFEYNNIDSLPPSNTFAIDHWGYWNGKNDKKKRFNSKIFFQF